MSKRHLLDMSVDFTCFSFSQQVENTVRRILLAEELEQNTSEVNENECQLLNFSHISEQILSKNFFSDESFSAGSVQQSTSEETLQFDEDMHFHSLQCCMSVSEFHTAVGKMSKSQMEALKYVKFKFENSQLPFHVFITGGAGVGKTFITKAIIAYLQLFCAKITNSNPVIVCAPTGTAANNINGKTLHSVLKIPATDFL